MAALRWVASPRGTAVQHWRDASSVADQTQEEGSSGSAHIPVIG